MNARVLVVGAGGLGCPASLALARAGVTRLTLVDPDRVDISNLHRQLWYRASDVGQLKVQSAADRLKAAFPSLEVAARPEKVDAASAAALFQEHDLVIDGTDGVADKFMLSDAAARTGVTLIYGGVLRLEGQAMTIRRGGPCLRCLFESINPDEAPSCAQAGVLGTMAGVIGGLQALLGLQALQDKGAAADTSTLHVIDGRSLTARTLTVRKAPDCKSCGAAA